MGLFFTTYFTYTENILNQQKLLQEQNNNFLKIQEKFEIFNPFYSQGRFGIFLKNKGNTKINFKDSNFKECFSVYFNNEFISKDKYNIYLLKNLAYNYNILDLEEEAIISFNTNYNLSINNTIKIISCLGNSLEYTIEKEKISWWNENYRERKTFSIENPSNKSLFEYQILLDLNSSNFDFDNIKEKEFRFVFNYDYGLELSLNFDEYENTLKENSNNININANLGNSNLNEINNPLEEKNGIFKNGLKFNLDEQVVNINSLSNLEEYTISLWFKTNFSSSNQSILNFKDINKTITINNGICFNDINHSCTNTNPIENIWNHLIINSKGEVYLNKIKQDNIETSFIGGHLQIGNSSLNDFKGSIDELKIYKFELDTQNIENLFLGKPLLKELDYYNARFEVNSKIAKIYVKLPILPENKTIQFEMYYSPLEIEESNSNIENTFFYEKPREFGMILSQLAANSGLEILALYDNTSIIIGNNQISLNKLETATLNSAQITLGDKIKTNKLVNIEGIGDGKEAIMPISWAGLEFAYRGFRANPDRFCIVSASENEANVQIYDNSINVWSGNIDKNVQCINTLNIGTNNNLRISSDYPILITYYGSVSNDAFNVYPSTKEDLFGVAGNSLFIASGNNNANLKIYSSNGNILENTLNQNDTINYGGLGANGNGQAFRIISSGKIGAITQADGDGTESAQFVPFSQMAKKFASINPFQYIVLASPYQNANCSLYDSFGNLNSNQEFGTGILNDNIFKYSFGNIGINSLYLNGPWLVECDKAVWGYYEDANTNDETTFTGHIQIRQYNYPEPIIIY